MVNVVRLTGRDMLHLRDDVRILVNGRAALKSLQWDG
jgi:hypothetical protein